VIFAGLAPYKWAACAAVVAALCLGSAWKGYAYGHDRTEMRWQAAEQRRLTDSRSREESNRHAAHAAASEYERNLQRIAKYERRSQNSVRASEKPASAARLGDIVLPADWFGGLRNDSESQPAGDRTDPAGP
jgi:hypothetical protein